MTSMMPKGYGIGASGRVERLQPPAQGGGFGAPQTPAGGFGMPQQPNPVNPVSPGMPGTQGGGGTSIDTGGLPSNPGGGFGGPAPAPPQPMPPVSNTYNTSRTYNNRTSQVFNKNQSTTNVDNSMTTQGQRMQRKTKAQLNPFQAINPQMEQKMIGDPSNPISQLKIMRGR
jgi:hypothetical protein